MDNIEDKLKQGDFYCIKNNKNQLLSLADLNKKMCYEKCECDGDYINCRFLDYRILNKKEINQRRLNELN